MVRTEQGLARMSNSQVRIEVEDGEVLVTGSPDLHTRLGRRFFQAVLGGRQIDEGWRIPRRGRRIQDIVVRVNNFLDAEGFEISRGELAERGVDLALETGP